MDDFAELRDLIDSLQDVSITEEPKILPHPVFTNKEKTFFVLIIFFNSVI